MFTFCVVSHDTKQKMQNPWECALEIIFNCCFDFLYVMHIYKQTLTFGLIFGRFSTNPIQ